jgi:phosphoadenosine phosphosulfate reductase
MRVGASPLACQAANIEELNASASAKRLNQLVEQASDALLVSASGFANPVFPCALIAGDVVILHLLHKLDLMENGVKPALCTCCLPS